MPEEKHNYGRIAIWFFVGLLLTVYGIIIVATGLYHLGSPSPHPAVLANLHPEIWWGAVLLAIGLFYVIRFFPRKRL
ncbi:MAG: hypothetical protein ACRD34_01405 [Bryobacteraceae bacterium]